VSKEELKQEKPWLASIGGFSLVLPLLMMALVFTAPKALISAWPGLLEEMASNEELVTDSTLLRVLNFADEDYLINLGTDTAERIAQDHAIMANYAHRGLFGEGYLQVDVLTAKAVTALNDNVSAVFIFAQFGVVGAVAVLVAYIAILLGALGARESINSLTSWLALMAGMSFALVSLYMMAANYGLLPFTGRNMYLLGLNSWSDVAESFVLIFLIMLGIARAQFRGGAFGKPSSGLTDVIEGNDLNPSPLSDLIRPKN
jgi:cell division protein FtsW (lipid II flippase)